MYDGSRFFTITGAVVDAAHRDVQPLGATLARLHNDLLVQPAPTSEFGRTGSAAEAAFAVADHDAGQHSVEPAGATITGGSTVSDDDLIARMRAAKNGPKFIALFERGDSSDYDGDASAADMALSNILVWWCDGDTTRADRLFRRSALMRPKWDERHYSDGRTYGAVTLERAAALVDQRARAGESDTRAGVYRGAPSEHARRPSVRVNGRQLRDVVDEVHAAMIAANTPPRIFSRQGSIVRLTIDERGRPHITPHTADSLKDTLSRVCDFFETRKKGGETIDTAVYPPVDVVRALLAKGDWQGLPPLVGVTETPVLHQDGSLHTVSGYDAATCLWYAPRPDLRLPAVPDAPSADDVRVAVAALDDIFIDFPFVSSADRAAVWSALVTATLRPLIDGPTPLHIFDKPRAGTGASLLAEVIALVATGAPAEMKTLPTDRNGDEVRKGLTASLLLGSSLIILDNVDMGLSSGHLAAALTAREWTDRLLGRSEMVRVPVNVTWVATTNNVQVRGDIARRSLVARLDARVECPWQRPKETFRHPDLLRHVRQHRGELLAAIFTLARAWLRAGRPPGANPTLGSFESWSATVGGILTFAGVDGLLANISEFYASADQDIGEWTAFLSAVLTWSQGEPFTVVELTTELGGECSQLVEVVPASVAGRLGRPNLQHSLGRALASKDESRFSGLRLVRCGFHHHATRWQVISERDEKHSD